MSNIVDPTLIVDGKAECQYCAGYYTVKADGSLRSHQCSGVDAGTSEKPETVKRARASKSTNTRASKNKPPDTVQRLTLAAVGTGVEFLAKRSVAAATDLPAKRIPDEVVELSNEDAQAMITPILNAAWPKMPDKVRKGIIALAEHEDLIACMFAWHDYFAKLRKFNEEVIALRKIERAAQTPTPTVIESEQANEFPIQANGYEPSGDSVFGTLEPFIPASG